MQKHVILNLCGMYALFDRQFGQFDYTQSGPSSPQYPDASYYPPAANTYTGSIMTPDVNTQYAGETSDFENEPPLMEGNQCGGGGSLVKSGNFCTVLVL